MSRKKNPVLSVELTPLELEAVSMDFIDRCYGGDKITRAHRRAMNKIERVAWRLREKRGEVTRKRA